MIGRMMPMRGWMPKPACSGCGGPHAFDTSVPSHLWNRVVRASGLGDYLCTSCIVAAFVKAGEGFTAELYGHAPFNRKVSETADTFDFNGQAIEVRVGGQPLEVVRELRDENNRLRSALADSAPDHPLLSELCRPPAPTAPDTVTVTREQLERLRWDYGGGRHCRACFRLHGKCAPDCWLAAALAGATDAPKE
jgi:hypothetical protein